MNFNSLEFLILFLPTTLIAFYAVPMRMRLLVLISASLFFYGVSGLEVLAAFVVTVLWTMLTAQLFGRWPKALAVVAAVSVPMLFLVLFKYLNFILNTLHAPTQARDVFQLFLSITLPAGISFYTFEMVSYSADVANKKIQREGSLLRFASFATFFPHLIAGPIMRYADLRDQLQALQVTRILKPNIVSGLKFLSIGLFAKVFLADLSGIAVDHAREAPSETITALDQIAQIGFWSMQIYYDFWAYSIMAIGLGRLFCIELPVNFRQPYLSANPQEFWRRWHVTLSYWIRDYLYIPLGGNKSYARNILFVFAIVGLWHGAGWNFVAWGFYHGVLVVIYHFTSATWDRLPKPLAIGFNFALVSLGWPLFFMDFAQYAAFLGHLVTAPWAVGIYHAPYWIYLTGLGVVTFAFDEQNWLYNTLDRRTTILDSPITLALLMFTGLIFISLSKTFIYFRF